MDMKNKNALAGMAASVLRPLIKVLISHNFSHANLTELVRKTYVEVAYDAFSTPSNSQSKAKMTYSRAAVLTGLSRKEVVRLKRLIEREQWLDNDQHQLAIRVARGWASDKSFQDVNGEPKVLTLAPGDASFASLVKKYTGGNVHAGVLEQLNKLGITSQSDLETVTLVNKGLVTLQDELEKIKVISVCVSDLFSTAEINLHASDADIRFQRQLVYSGIEESLARQLHAAGSEKAMALFNTLNNFLIPGRDQLRSDHRSPSKRVGLGIYYFEDAKQVKSVKMTSEEHA